MSEKNRRTNYLKQSGIKGMASWTILFLFVVKMIYMSYQTGMNGVSYYAYADAVFVLCYILFGVAVLKIEKRLIYFQINHGNYKNAMKVYRVISGSFIAIVTIVSLLLFFGATQISVWLFDTKLCALLVQIMAIAIWFWTIMFSLKGYMEGIGNAMPGIYADLLSFLTALIVTILLQPAFSDYGKRVSALMRQDSYAYAYAACSGVLGLAIGGLVGMLFLIMVRSVFGKEIRRRVRSDEARKTDSAQDILWNFFSNYFMTAMVEHIGVILAIVLFVIYSHMNGLTQGGTGMLYVGIVVLVLPSALIAWQISVPFTRQLTSIMKQSDYHHAKERMSFYLKLLSYTVLPLALVGFALASLLAEILFDVEYAAFTELIKTGMSCSVLVAYGIFFRQVLSVVVKPYVRNLCAGILGLSGIGFWFILSWSGQAAEESVAYAYILACLLYLLLSGFFAIKKIRIYNRLLVSVGMPLLASVFTAAISFGIYVLLAETIPAGGLFLLIAVVAYLVFELVCVVFRLFASHEWMEVPASGFPVILAKMLGKY